jgi:cysteine-rich repeat protein
VRRRQRRRLRRLSRRLQRGVELCDDGNTADGDGCDANCTISGCGNGVLNAGEACDDGNGESGDGCDANCTITGCGNGVQTDGEACDDGNTDDTDACLSTCVAAACGDGLVQAGVEGCDDGNTADGDCCSSACQPTCESEPNNACTDPSVLFTPSPSVVIRGAITPIGDQDLLAFTVPALATVRVETFSGTTPGACTAIDTLLDLYAPDCTTVLASDDDSGINNCSLIDPTVASGARARRLAPGTYFVRAHEFGDNGAIAAYNVQISLVSLCGNNVVEPNETCDDGNLVDGDGCDSNCTVTACGNGVLTAGEACDDGNTSNTDACLDTCVAASCNDGFVHAGVESCEDGNTNPGDGCSAACAGEPGFQCTSAVPAVCSPAEDICNDGVDNDGDGVIDLADSDCTFGSAITPCAAGETLLVYNSVDVPRAITDNTTFFSGIFSANPGVIQRAIVGLSITHTFDGDLDLGLKPPVGSTIDLSSDNGADGANFTNTVFDSTCATAVTAGTAPFTGCFRPEQTLAVLTGQPATGSFQLSVGDDGLDDTGALTRWSLALCVTP